MLVDRGDKALFLTGFVLTATLHVLYLLDAGQFGYFATTQLPLQPLLTDEAGNKGKET